VVGVGLEGNLVIIIIITVMQWYCMSMLRW